jgi:hypothetical protein
MSASAKDMPAKRRVEITPTGKPRQFETGGRSVTFVPLAIKRRHGSKVIGPPTGVTDVKTTSSFDLPLIRTLGKAFYWQRLIDTGGWATPPNWPAASGLRRVRCARCCA